MAHIHALTDYQQVIWLIAGKSLRCELVQNCTLEKGHSRESRQKGGGLRLGSVLMKRWRREGPRSGGEEEAGASCEAAGGLIRSLSAAFMSGAYFDPCFRQMIGAVSTACWSSVGYTDCIMSVFLRFSLPHLGFGRGRSRVCFCLETMIVILCQGRIGTLVKAEGSRSGECGSGSSQQQYESRWQCELVVTAPQPPIL